MNYDNTELSLQEIHEACFELLVKIRSLCDKIGIEFWLAYGTLLGAVRHQGFIPWDDDVDLWMTRDHYDKFFDYLSKNLEELYPISYCSRRNTKDYSFAINRITDMRYRYLDTKMNCELDYGIFIDVYPLDYVGNDKKTYFKMYKKIRKLNIAYSIYLQNKSFSGKVARSVMKKVFHWILHILFKNQISILDYVEYRTNSILGQNPQKDSALVGVAVWFAYIQCYEKELFDETIKIKFNGELFTVPKEYEKLLHIIYGDYMILPPEEKRIAYHGYKIYRR